MGTTKTDLALEKTSLADPDKSKRQLHSSKKHLSEKARGLLILLHLSFLVGSGSTQATPNQSEADEDSSQMIQPEDSRSIEIDQEFHDRLSMPKDLTQLIALWDLEDVNENQEDEAIEASKYRNLSTMAYEIHDTSIIPFKIGAEEFSKSHAELDSQGSFNFSSKSLVDDARKVILKDLFSDKSEVPKFCQSFSFPTYKVKDSKILSETDLEMIKNKKTLTACKKKISNLLGGIFHAQSRIQHQYSANDQHAKSTIYIGSLIDDSKFLRYEFQIR